MSWFSSCNDPYFLEWLYEHGVYHGFITDGLTQLSSPDVAKYLADKYVDNLVVMRNTVQNVGTCYENPTIPEIWFSAFEKRYGQARLDSILNKVLSQTPLAICWGLRGRFDPNNRNHLNALRSLGAKRWDSEVVHFCLIYPQIIHVIHPDLDLYDLRRFEQILDGHHMNPFYQEFHRQKLEKQKQNRA